MGYNFIPLTPFSHFTGKDFKRTSYLFSFFFPHLLCTEKKKKYLAQRPWGVMKHWLRLRGNSILFTGRLLMTPGFDGKQACYKKHWVLVFSESLEESVSVQPTHKKNLPLIHLWCRADEEKKKKGDRERENSVGMTKYYWDEGGREK